MTIIQKVKQAVGGIFKPALGPSQITFDQIMTTLVWAGGTTGDTYPNVNVSNSVRLGFQQNAAVYSIVMKDANKFGSIPRYVWDATKKEEKSNEIYTANKDLTKLLNRPNPYEGQDFFYTKIRAYHKVCGEAFIYLNRGDLEPYRNPDGTFNDDAIDVLPVLEMNVLPADHIALIPDPFNIWGVLGYVLEISGRRIVLRKGDVIHWKTVSLDFDAGTRSHLRGMPPLQPGAELLAESTAVNNSSKRAAETDGAKAALFEKSLKAMTPEQQSQIKAVIDRKINNTDVSGSVAALQGDWGLLDLSMSSKDQMHIEKKQNILQQFCFLFAVPYEFFDPRTTFANKKEAQKGWVTNDIMPACNQLDNEFNRVIPKSFGLEDKVFIGSDDSELPEMQIDIAAMATGLAAAWWITPNEKREMMEQEPIDDPKFDQPFIPSGVTPLEDMVDPMQEQAMQIELNRVTNGLGKNGNGALPKAGGGKNVSASTSTNGSAKNGVSSKATV